MGGWTPEGVVWMPLAGYLGPVEVRDDDWNRLPHEREALDAAGPAIARIGREVRQFLR